MDKQTKCDFVVNFERCYKGAVICDKEISIKQDQTHETENFFVKIKEFLKKYPYLYSFILFNIFYGFFSYWLALWGALFFAFHTSYVTWLGWLVCQMYHLNLLLFLLILLTFRRYLHTNKYGYYFFSCFLYVLSLFLHESMIVFPLWMIFAIYFYETYGTARKGLSIKAVFRYIRLSGGFWITVGFYLFVRITNFPIKWGESNTYMSTNIFTFFSKLPGRFMQLVSFASDILGFAWMPGGHRVIKGSLIIIFSTLLFWLFLKSAKKRYLIFFMASFLWFMWPAILVYYHPRYFYISFPFFILIILFCIKFHRSSSALYKRKFQRLSYVFLYFLLIWNASFLIARMKYKENFLSRINLAFKEISINKQVKNRALCFIGVPSSWFSQSVAPAMWMYLGDSSHPVYHALEWSLDMEGPVKGDCLDILPIKGGFRLISKNPEQLYFYGSWDNESSGGPFSMGMRIVNGRIPDKIYDASFVFDEKWLKKDILFITWDFEKERFVILDKKPIR